jgi:hypothetical protein
MSKPGFGGQWVQIMRAGTHRDNEGVERRIDSAFLDSVVANFDAEEHEPPAVIGHPEMDAPAFGYVNKLRRKGDLLEAQFSDTDSAFEKLVRDGKFKKRSAAFYLDPTKAPSNRAPALRHVGFLGAQPPAIKGLKNIHFAEGQSTTIELSEPPAIAGGHSTEGDDMNEDQVKKTVSESIAEFFRKLGGKDKSPAEAGTLNSASFSEADARKLVTDSVAAIETKFTEKVTALEAENKSLKEKIDAQVGSSKRGEIVQFCESLGREGKFLPAFKAMGVVEFMESLAASDQKGDQKVTVISFSEENGKRTETKTEFAALDWFKTFLGTLPAYVQFGEGFGKLQPTGDGSEIVDPGRMKEMMGAIGIKPEVRGQKSYTQGASVVSGQ